MKDGIVLFAHGSRDPQWARPFEELAATLSLKTSAVVRVAYLELMQPTFADAITALAAEGITAVRVVPVFLGQGGHTKQDLPKLVAAARDRHPGIDISLDPPIGEQRSVIEAIAAAIAR
ncbi:MAG TPA: CbiX/SirB N-terminal domain-containing protein [Burkholderiales bacterium]|nr:CbiX/SirB N-terminal domain-containing protein [Burkholderiales bacterium]